jgi:hypothetical protein
MCAVMLSSCETNPPAEVSRWPASEGKWTKFAEAPLGGLYYARDSIKDAGSIKRITVLVDYRDTQIRQDREVLSGEYFLTVDCGDRVVTVDGQSGYSDRMGRGKPSFAAFHNPRYQPPEAKQRVFKEIFEVLCKAQG